MCTRPTSKPLQRGRTSIIIDEGHYSKPISAHQLFEIQEYLVGV
jgi:hypothetical protein